MIHRGGKVKRETERERAKLYVPSARVGKPALTEKLGPA